MAKLLNVDQYRLQKWEQGSGAPKDDYDRDALKNFFGIDDLKNDISEEILKNALQQYPFPVKNIKGGKYDKIRGDLRNLEHNKLEINEIMNNLDAPSIKPEDIPSMNRLMNMMQQLLDQRDKDQELADKAMDIIRELSRKVPDAVDPRKKGEPVH